MPSVEMKEYLKTPRQSVDSIADIIYFSPVPLKQKYEGLCNLRQEPEVSNEWKEDCNIFIIAIEKATELLDVEGIFTLEWCCFDEKNNVMTMFSKVYMLITWM